MGAERHRPRVFSIPAGAPFLPTLAEAILSNRLVPIDRDDPLRLADLTILLPTRRAVRALREILIERLGGDAAILPAIRPIGDVDEEDHLLNVAVETGADRLALPPSISPLARHLALTRLILQWGRTVRRELLKLGPDEPLLIPASAADAARLAGDLARLLDDLNTAGIDFDALGRLVPDDQAGYFQITLDFLKIVAEHWPRILADMNRVDPAARRDHLIRAEAQRLDRSRSAGPIVAAGSTGSIPATALLLKAIAHLPNGAVVLPGLDQFLDDTSFAAIGDPEEPRSAAFGHPQFGLKKLVGDLGIGRDEVESLGSVGKSIDARARLLSEAMRPAQTTDGWLVYRRKEIAPRALEHALAGVGLIVAKNEQEEALAIALALRETVETPDAVAALVTPDRGLARRDAVELGRWNLVIDDSAGARLDLLPPGIFAKLLLEAALGEGDPVALLALLKHPLAAFGMARAACRRAARTLEIALLRGNRVTGGVAALRAALSIARAEVLDPKTRHVAPSRRRLSSDAWDEADALLATVSSALEPIEMLFRDTAEISTAALASALAESVSHAARDDTGSDVLLWQGPSGEALSRLLAELTEKGGDLLLSPAEAPAFLAALMADVSVTRPVGADPRIHIWGALEARLQSADLLILAGLDEGVWPAETRTDPWLSRTMRAEIGLDPPERRIGLSAHDFTQAIAAPRVLVTRAEKRGGTPTVASRWLQRLTALLGEAPSKRLRERGETYLNIARRLDRVRQDPVQRVRRPEPNPPLDARPRSLSITEIETLVRDPYAIYARHVLKLEPLDPLGTAPDYALRGTLIHDALGSFTGIWSGGFDEDAERRLLEIGRKVLADIAAFPDTHAVWMHRFRSIGRWFLAWERDRDSAMVRRFAEISGGLEFATREGIFRLRGRADRIDLRKDGSLEILDFKTGAPPSAKQVLTGFAPQLALEVAMARAGAFGEEFAGRSVAVLGWLALGQVDRGEPFKSAVEKDWTADALGEEALQRLTALIAAFEDKDRAYVSRARPMFETRFESDYDHLARVREWSVVETGEEGS
jgi:ATP-dependent helicase/nuclease subunit B